MQDWGSQMTRLVTHGIYAASTSTLFIHIFSSMAATAEMYLFGKFVHHSTYLFAHYLHCLYNLPAIIISLCNPKLRACVKPVMEYGPGGNVEGFSFCLCNTALEICRENLIIGLPVPQSPSAETNHRQQR